jgi:hypothetical protein
MHTSEKIALGALVCSVVPPVLSFLYLDQQIKGFNDRQLVYRQKRRTTTDAEVSHATQTCLLPMLLPKEQGRVEPPKGPPEVPPGA